MTAVPQPADPPGLGVLFVHGIGQQRQGETLVHFADPLSRWLARWLSDGQHTEADVGRLDGARVAVGGVELTPDDGPARLTLRIPAGTPLTPSGEQRWLLAESWWAETFEPPKTASLLAWMLLILPYMMLLQTSEKLRRARRKPRAGAWGKVARAVRTVAFGTLYVTALPLAALGAIAIVLLLVGILLPIQSVSDRAKKVALLLSSTMGDSYILTSSAVQFDAMVARVARDLAWLAGQVEQVVVVAHSQGTAVSYDALRSADVPANLRTFVTLGEAIKKLQVVRALQTYGEPRPAVPVRRFGAARVRAGIGAAVVRWLKLKSYRFAFGWVGLVGVYLLGYAVPQLVFIAGHEHTHLVRAAILTGLGLGAAAGALWVCARYWREDFEEQPDRLRAGGRDVRWADFYASADPVPNGPLFHTLDKVWINETEVWNYASILRDHTSYTTREDDFLAELVRELLHAADAPVPETLLERGRWRSWWRVWWLTAARAVAAAAAIATVASVWGRLRIIGLRVSGWPHWGSALHWVGGKIVSAVERLIIVHKPDRAQVAGGLTVLVVVAGGYLLLSAIWAYWQRQDVKRFYQHTSVESDTDPLGGRELLWFLFTLSVLTLIDVVTCISGDYAEAWNWVVGHRWLSLAIFTGMAVGPIVLAWLLRPLLRELEPWLMDKLPRQRGAWPPEAADAVEALPATVA